MKCFRITGLMLLALFALGAFAASMASAEEGVLPTGAAGTGSGGKTTLETEKSKISCTALKILALQWLPKSDQHGTSDLHFTGCKAEGLVPVKTASDASEVILAIVLYLICLVNSTTLTFGVLIEPVKEVVVEIPATNETVTVKGAVIGELVKGQALKAKVFEWSLEGKKGTQEVAKECEINGKVFKHTYLSKQNAGGAFIPTSQKGPFKLEFPGEAEVMDT